MPSAWTLITVSFNSARDLEKYWSHAMPSSVQGIVVDKKSADDSVAVARRLGATVVEVDSNIGFSAANNRGLASATGTHVPFVNPDVWVEFADLPQLAKTIDLHGGLVSSQLINDDGRDQSNGGGAPLPLLSKVLNRLSARSSRRHHYLVFAASHEQRHVFWTMGAAVAGKASTFAELRGWDERFFIHYEDKDITIRAWRSGKTVVLAGQYWWTHRWAHETAHFRLSPWMREISSLVKFYTRYPEFIFGGESARRHNAEAWALSGEVLCRG